MPSRPVPRRSQKDAFIVPRCAGSPGVPASTSRNGASPRTLWPAVEQHPADFRVQRMRLVQQDHQRLPAASGAQFPRQGVRRFGGGRRPFRRTHGRDAHLSGQQLRHPGPRRQRGGEGGPARDLVRVRTTVSSSRSSQACLNQLSSTVLPLPRGPVRTTSWRRRCAAGPSPRGRLNTACSGSRPVSAGGVAPDPGVNRRCFARFHGGQCMRSRRSGDPSSRRRAKARTCEAAAKGVPEPRREVTGTAPEAARQGEGEEAGWNGQADPGRTRR